LVSALVILRLLQSYSNMRQFLAPAALLSLIAIASAAKHELIVGTFGSAYLYTVEFDDEALTLDLVANTSTPGSSSWIALSHDKANLYGTNYQASVPGFVSYSLSNATDITYEATVDAGGNCTASAIFVVADQNPPYAVYGSFFGTNAGCGSVISVDETGVLEAVVQNYTYFNSSGVHGTAFSPDSKFLYSTDDPGNTVWTHGVDAFTGEVTLLANLTAPSDAAHPRHGAVHPNGQYLYVILEGTSQLAEYAIDQATGIPSFANVTYPLLESGQNASSFWADEVALSYSTKYLWATNRYRGSMGGAPGNGTASTNGTGYISVFTLDDGGAILEQNFLLPTTSTGGAANSVAPSPFTDRFAALTDSSTGFLEIWELATDGASAQAVAHLDLDDGGCCANAVWYS
jgi:carboxy-cis,cis-muconate cyclase